MTTSWQEGTMDLNPPTDPHSSKFQEAGEKTTSENTMAANTLAGSTMAENTTSDNTPSDNTPLESTPASSTPKEKQRAAEEAVREVAARPDSTQPDNRDIHDPLNWSQKKKNLVLVAICYMSFMTDFLAGYGVPMIIPQSKEWGITTEDATRSVVGNTLTQGFGSLLAVPFTQRYGTQPVMFWSTLMALLMTITCGLCPGWIGFIAVRIVQGFFATTAQVIGLTVIQDIFVFEERVRKVGIWGWSVVIGPYAGPWLSAFITEAIGWRDAFFLIAGVIAIGLLLVVFVMDETTYDRRCLANNPPRPSTYASYKIQAVTGMMGHKAKGRTTFWEGTREIFSVLVKPQFLLIFLWHGITYSWSVGINGSLITFLVVPPPKGYGFNGTAIGLVYFAPMIAVVCGELFGHFANDWIQNRATARNGTFEPEARLWGTYFSTPFMILGLSLLGVALQHVWHWSIVTLAWGIFVFSAMTATVIVSAYELDCFPEKSAAASALLNFARVLFGFIVPLFQTKWAAAVGANWSFGTQAIICLVAFAIIPVVQKYGKTWRMRSGSPAVSKVVKTERDAEGSVVAP